MEHGPRRFYIAASQGFVGLFVAALCAVSLGLGREPIVGGATLLLVLLALAYEHVIGKRRTASGDAPAGPGSAAGRVRPRAQVWIQRGQSKGRYLVGQTLLVGRGAECGLQLIYDEGVSRQHCHFASTENGFVLLDLDSSNGTYVNGDKVIDQVVVEDGDVIRCGAAELIFRTKVDPLHELKPGSVIVERERPMISEWAGLSPNQHLVAEANGQPEGGSLPVRRLDRSLPLNSLVGSIPDEVELAAGPPEAVSFEDREETELLNSLVTLGREEHPGLLSTPVDQAVLEFFHESGECFGRIPIVEHLTIGRQLPSDLVRPGGKTSLARLSRSHFEILPTDEGYRLRDLDSTNGTYVNGCRVLASMIQDGDSISAGSVLMRFREPVRELAPV